LKLKIRVEIIIESEVEDVNMEVYNMITQNLCDDLYVGADNSAYKDLKLRTIHKVSENV
jgi:hypothetical protein